MSAPSGGGWSVNVYVKRWSVSVRVCREEDFLTERIFSEEADSGPRAAWSHR